MGAITSLNPFEVREVLQENQLRTLHLQDRLNPFEVREVLQVHIPNHSHYPMRSQSL